MNRSNAKIIGMILGIGFLALIAYSIYTVVSRNGKEPVQVYILPSDAIVTVDGKKISTGVEYLSAGTHEIQAKSEGFSDFKGTITIGKTDKEAIDIGLNPISDNAKEWAKKNQKLYLDREGRSGERSREKGKEFNRLNPITKQLPITNVLYSIGYTIDPSDPSNNSIILQVQAAQGYREAMLAKIRELGYDPTNFKINFKVYESPFGNE